MGNGRTNGKFDKSALDCIRAVLALEKVHCFACFNVDILFSVLGAFLLRVIENEMNSRSVSGCDCKSTLQTVVDHSAPEPYIRSGE